MVSVRTSISCEQERRRKGVIWDRKKKVDRASVGSSGFLRPTTATVKLVSVKLSFGNPQEG